MSATTSFAESITNIYDDLNRLIRTEYGDGTALTYDYDEVGNRTQKYIRPTACTNLPTRISGTSPVYYPTLLAVYAAATSGASIQTINTSFIENPNFTRTVSIILDGGYGCDYTSNPNYTTIKGTMTITSGTVSISNIILQ
jgi:YD repeat-containing protein